MIIVACQLYLKRIDVCPTQVSIKNHYPFETSVKNTYVQQETVN